MISIDEMQTILEELAEEIPEPFFRGLNGGILLLPDRVLNPHAKNNDLYIMGEYITDPAMGRYIALYYGSFQAVYGTLGVERLRGELRETLFHEFTHHLESLAGENGLEVKDREELAEYLRGEK